jgi:hypothetical protein
MNRATWLQDRRMQKFRDVLSRWEGGKCDTFVGELVRMQRPGETRRREHSSTRANWSDTDMARKQDTTLGRRAFLQMFGAGSTVIATMPLAAEERSDHETRNAQHDARYRETDHVKAFYSVNRYAVK